MEPLMAPAFDDDGQGTLTFDTPATPEGRCATCGQFLPRTYRHAIGLPFLRVLRILYEWHRREPHAWVHRDPIETGHGCRSYSKLRFWNLTEECPTQSGRWRISQLGCEFLEGRIAVKKTIRIRENTFIGFVEDAPLVYVHEVINPRYDGEHRMHEWLRGIASGPWPRPATIPAADGELAAGREED